MLQAKKWVGISLKLLIAAFVFFVALNLLMSSIGMIIDQFINKMYSPIIYIVTNFIMLITSGSISIVMFISSIKLIFKKPENISTKKNIFIKICGIVFIICFGIQYIYNLCFWLDFYFREDLNKLMSFSELMTGSKNVDNASGLSYNLYLTMIIKFIIGLCAIVFGLLYGAYEFIIKPRATKLEKVGEITNNANTQE